jgi:hypothetical protein
MRLERAGRRVRTREAEVILFVSGATATVRRHRDVGELIVPGAGNAPDALRLTPGRWAMDNGAFLGFDAGAFMRMLQRFHGRRGCRFVAAPDAVADAHQTLHQWPFWSAVIRGAGFVPALVLQDGMLVSEIPWPELGAVFVGGTTEWKLGPQARELVAYARARGLWVHVGRVNSGKRVEAIYRMGAQSFDGTGFSIAPDINIPKGLDWIESAATGLFS